MVGYRQTNQKTDTGKTLTRWPVFVDHFTMALPSTPAMSYQVNPVFNLTVAPEVPLTLVSDASRLSDYIDFQARASARSFEQSLTLQINSGQSTAGG